MAPRPAPKNVDDYIARFPPDVRPVLRKVRQTVRAVAPVAEERISYGIPAYRLDGDLVYFAAFKKHIGMYPPVRGDEKLIKQLERYRGEKGNLKFPLDEPMPYGLIRKVVLARMREQRGRARKRSTKSP